MMIKGSNGGSPAKNGGNPEKQPEPGPQIELYLHGKRLIDAFPMVPLAKNQAVGVALLSYAGNINFGLVGDYDLMWDLDDFADDVGEALAELADAAGVELTAMTAPSGQAVRA